MAPLVGGNVGDQTFQWASRRSHAGFIGQQAPDATTAPRASLAIPRTWGARVSLAGVTTTSTRRTQKPVTRRPGGASSACTTRRASTASSAASVTMATPSSRIVAVRCPFPLPAPLDDFHSLPLPPPWGILSFRGLSHRGKCLFRGVKFHW